MDIRTILLAANLSDTSRAAGYHAIGLARRFNARIVALHVDEIGAPDEGVSDALAEYLAEVEAHRSRWMSDLISAGSSAGVEIETAEIVGEPDEGILDWLDENDAQLVVLGRAEHEGARRFFVGSTCKRVLRSVHVPTLVVPYDPDEDPPPAGPVEYEHVLTTTDFSKPSDVGLEYAHSLAHYIGAKLTALHVARTPLIGAIPEEALDLPSSHLQELQEEVEVRLSENIDKLGWGGVDVAATVGTSVPKAILDAAGELDIDLIVIPSQGKGRIKRLLMGSTVDRVLGASEHPLLVLPRAWIDAQIDED